MEYCTFYIDGSGDEKWPPPIGKSNHNFHTLAGLILDPEKDLKAKQKVCGLLREFIPESTRNIRPPSEYELHYVAIDSGKGIYRKIKQESRQELIAKTFDLILELKPILIASTVDKAKEYQIWGQKSFLPEIHAMRSVVHKFSMHLNRRNKIGTVVYDADKFNFDLFLREAVQNFRRFGINIPSASFMAQTDYLPNILNNINFCPSDMSTGLQLADFVASAVWRKYERSDSRWYDKLDSLWEYDEVSKRTYKDHIIS